MIRLPFGCGEQNMIHFAPIVYVMDYLKRTRQLTPETEAEAKTFLVQGIYESFGVSFYKLELVIELQDDLKQVILNNSKCVVHYLYQFNQFYFFFIPNF